MPLPGSRLRWFPLRGRVRLRRVHRLLLVAAGVWRRWVLLAAVVVVVWRRMFLLAVVVVLCHHLARGRCRHRLILRVRSARRRNMAAVRGLRWWPAAGVPVLVRL